MAEYVHREVPATSRNSSESKLGVLRRCRRSSLPPPRRSSPGETSRLETTADANVDGGGDGGGRELLIEEVDGLVAIEAEHFSSNDANGTPREWYLTTASIDPDVSPDPDPPHLDDASGGGYIECLPVPPRPW